MDKKQYYVNVGSHEISQIKHGNNDTYTIYATADEVRLLRAKLDNMHDADVRSFWRAHVPIVSYHHDQPNDDHDQQFTEAFQMLYELGDEETRAHIDEMGILTDRHM